MKKSLHIDSEAFKRMMKALKENRNSKLLAITLRFRLLVEYYLDLIIAGYIKRGFVLVDSNITFFQKINVVDYLGVVPENVIISTKKLNALRNKSAHDIDYRISEKDRERILLKLICSSY